MRTKRQRNSPDHALPDRGSRSAGVSHCSALIKLLPDKSDVVFAHNTWDDFQAAYPRIFKNYQHALLAPSSTLGAEAGAGVVLFDVHFSSSPALLSSVDDFYTINGNARLAVTETTLDIYTKSLLEAVVPEAMLAWSRARVANQLAKDGPGWVDLFTNYSAGTYANEWMVLDLTKFTPGGDPKKGFLMVLEEVPGYAHWEDMTSHISTLDYWASYNNPYFDDIAELSGNAALCRQDKSSCHLTDPRALIFREQQGAARDIAGVQRLMGYNQFRSDPLSLNNSCNVRFPLPLPLLLLLPLPLPRPLPLPFSSSTSD